MRLAGAGRAQTAACPGLEDLRVLPAGDLSQFQIAISHSLLLDQLETQRLDGWFAKGIGRELAHRELTEGGHQWFLHGLAACLKWCPPGTDTGPHIAQHHKMTWIMRLKATTAPK